MVRSISVPSFHPLLILVFEVVSFSLFTYIYEVSNQKFVSVPCFLCVSCTFCPVNFLVLITQTMQGEEYEFLKLLHFSN
jgi:hypothetical protein